jgi:hypothetical protein
MRESGPTRLIVYSLVELLSVRARYTSSSPEDLTMMKIALLVVAAGVLTTDPLVTPVKAQGVKMAQVDMQTGRHYEDRDDRDYTDRRRYDSNRTIGVGPGGVTIGPRQRCRMETTTIERDDGRRITRRERVCD